MPAVRVSMRKVKEVLRLKWECALSERKIARSCKLSRPTVADYIKRAVGAGLGWPLPEGIDDAALDRLLFPPSIAADRRSRALPEWTGIHQELKRKGVTLFLLWEEYKAQHPNGYQYGNFCLKYRAWRAQLNLSMRQTHPAGEKLFVDYAGQSVPIVDSATGEYRPAQIFVAVLGASNYTYAEATWTQTLPDWIASHERAFRYFGGVTELVVPDNLRSAVTTAHRYDPDLNPTYHAFAEHYRVAVLPARVRRPRDKAKVEVAVQVVERWILARLRKHTFFSLAELNAEIHRLLEELNNRGFKKLPGTRRSVFESLERAALKSLPTTPYEFAEWKKIKVPLDYHIEVDQHYYSVPYRLVGQSLDAKFTVTTVQVLHKGQRVASHIRSYQKGHHTTLTEHLPPSHQAYAEWTPERLLNWATQIGPATAAAVASILCSRLHPHQGFRAGLGLLRLGKAYDPTRLEAACERALAIGSCSYKSIESILKHGLDRRPLLTPSTSAESPPIEHPHIRGPRYYH